MAEAERRTRGQKIGFLAGVLVFVLVLGAVELDPEKATVHRMAAVALLMSVWWLSDAIPLAATSLLPLILFPLLGIMPGEDTAVLYMNSTIFLLIGGFMIALAMERWDLHRRIALKIISWIGRSQGSIVLGFMAATAFMSMWISNTATAMMMVPIGMAVIAKSEEGRAPEDESGGRNLALCLMLGIAYSSSVGGMGTLIGTPVNLICARVLTITFPRAPEISFSKWLMMGAPFITIFILAIWFVLTKILYPPGKSGGFERSMIREEYRKLGPPSAEEKAVLSVFLVTAFLWMTRNDISLGTLTIPGWGPSLGLEGLVDDGTVAIAMALVLFLLPSKRADSGKVLDWHTMSNMPWGIVLLLGGGFALAGGMTSSGLSSWVGNRFSAVGQLSPFTVVGLICLATTFLTELTSNTATSQMILPILASVAVQLRIHPLFLMIPSTISASCAFMLPVATPPNAIVFGSGRVKIIDMARAGVILNFLGVALVTALMYVLAVRLFGIDLGTMPDWAVLD